MSDLLPDLQSALGPAYRVLREIGGGGMSRVFVAEELALGRQVAVKVLAPELMPGVSMDRFRQEMQVAARLQHPSIVPVLTTGSANGLTWFTMPFVAGETLRARLQRDGRFPVATALRLARDLFDALGAAHAAGVVHRDIKPENLFVADRHLLVADFGVARALSQSTQGASDAGTPRLTGVGVTLGTPAYMAPEQALADSGADHRVDIYAAGLVLYEMLAGGPPFTADTPQGMLAAHLTTPPEPLRTDVPAGLARLVMQCLEKEPAKRPARAHDVLDQLDALLADVSSATTPAGFARPAAARSRGKAASIVGGFVAMLLVAGGLWLQQRRAAAPTGVRDLVVVGHFTASAVDAALAGAVEQALRIDLGQSPKVRTPDPSRLRATLRAMQQADTVSLVDSLLPELARRLGAKAWISGAVTRAGAGFVLTARLVTVDGERELSALRESARDSSAVLDAIDRLARGLREQAGESVASLEARAPLPTMTTRSLPALERLAAGQRLISAGQPLEGAAMMRQAIQLDSNFASAWRLLAVALGNAGVSGSERFRALDRAYAMRARLPEGERLSIEGTWAQGRRDYRAAEQAWRALATLDPDALTPANNLAIALMDQGRPTEALPVLQAARRLFPTTATLIGNTISVHLALGDTAGADSLVALAYALKLRQASYFRAQRFAMTRRYQEVLAVADSAYRTAKDPLTLLGAGGDLVQLQAMTGQFAASGRLRSELGPKMRAAGEPNEAWTMELVNAQIRAEILGDTAGARALVAAVDRELQASRLDATQKPFGTLATAWASLGDTARATATLRLSARLRPAAMHVRDTVDRLTVAWFAAVKARRFDDAFTVLRQSMAADGFCAEWCYASLFARTFDAARQPDSTLAYIDHYLRPIGSQRPNADRFDLPWALKRAGEIHESRGETAKAIARYRELVHLWEKADAPLQPLVADLKARVARLEARRG